MSFQKTLSCFAIYFFLTGSCFSQKVLLDSSNAVNNGDIKYTPQKNEQVYYTRNDKVYIYPKPRLFDFITKLPADAAGMVSTTFQKKSIKPLLLIGGTTTILLFSDQAIANRAQQVCKGIRLQTAEKNKNLVTFRMGKKPTTLIKLPQNINTAFYQLGEGFYGLLVGAGLFTYGKLHNDYRSLSTASQLAESFILMGVGTQLLKRISGRETPGEATVSSGKWHLFPSFKNFQNNTPKYDAFPSGHLTTLMTTVTILGENYPEKKWILPVGYSITGLVGLAMINNGVHWASDYPLAIGLGYLCGRQIVKNSRRVLNNSAAKKNKRELSYTFNYISHTMVPGIIYKF